MPNPLVNIVKKEIKEIIRDPRLFLGMIIVPILMFPIMGVVVHGAMSETQKATMAEVDIAFLNLDNGTLAETILNSTNFKILLEQYNVTPVWLNEIGINDTASALSYLEENRSIQALIVIPKNFTSSILAQKKVTIEVYQNIGETFSIASSQGERATIIVEAINNIVSAYIILSMDPNADINFVKNPIIAKTNTIYKGTILENTTPSAIQSMLSLQMFMMPLASFMLITIAIQFAATSVASEKEQKTLETLLTLPISRTAIVLGKLTGSILVSIVGAVGYIIGLQFYMSSIMEGVPNQPINLSEIGLTIDVTGYTLIAIAMFLSLLVTLALVSILASFAEDVRTAQSLAGIIIVPVLIGGLYGMFSIMFAFGSPLTTASLLFIPFTNPVVLPIYVLKKDYLIIVLSLLALVIEVIVSIEAAAKFYGSEKILSAKISLSRKKKPKEVEV
ncbi:MAG: ABC transporter permease [Candidatus Njordarchaeia archaeon]